MRGTWVARFSQSGAFKHGSELEVGSTGVVTAEIIDLMFRVGEPIAVSLVNEDTGEDRTFSLSFEHYFPWIDWMVREELALEIEDKFRYWWPGCYNGQDAHSSWDFHTRAGCPVYSSTPGQIIYAVGSDNPRECDVCVYNPDVGGILQFGHVVPALGIRVGQSVEAGDLIGHVIDYSGGSGLGHIHFSVIRPAWEDKYSNQEWDLVGFRRVVANRCYYQDPLYFHEPTTWGYWNSRTLPGSAAESMKESFDKHNPGVGPNTDSALVRARDAEDRCKSRTGPSVSVDLAIPVDGEPESTWSDLGRRLTDKAGDTDQPGADVVAVYSYADGEYLFVRVDVVGSTPNPSGIAYIIGVTPLNYTPPGRSPATLSNVSSSEAVFVSGSLESDRVVFGSSEIVEFAIPLAWLGECDYVKIRCETRSLDEARTRYDYTRTFELHFGSL